VKNPKQNYSTLNPIIKKRLMSCCLSQINYTMILFICEQSNSISYNLIECVSAIQCDVKKQSIVKSKVAWHFILY
jgi:hypothetical protein